MLGNVRFSICSRPYSDLYDFLVNVSVIMEDKICVQILDLIQFIILAAIKAIARLTASMIVELKNILAFPL